MNSRARRTSVLAALLLALLLPAAAPAQRAVQSPLMVNVLRTRSDGGSQQMELKVTVRNMSKKEVEVRAEALFIASGSQRNGQDGIYCRRQDEAVLKPGESKSFEIESDRPSTGYYTYNGTYYYYSSMKVRGYLTRVFADGQLVNVTGSTPSFQKAGWDAKELAKLGYDEKEPGGGRSSVAERTPPVTPPAPVPAPPVAPATPVATATPAAPVTPSAPAMPAAPPAPAPAPTFDQKTYEEIAQVYNSAQEAYQGYLKNRGSAATLRRIENDLKFCVEEIGKISTGAPAELDLPGFLGKCQKTLFAVHATMQAQP